MSKFTFTHTLDDLKITHEFDEIQLNNVIENFESFLRGCGFVFNGNLEIIENSNFEFSSHGCETVSFLGDSMIGIEGAAGSDYISIDPSGAVGSAGPYDTYLGDWDTQCKNIDTIAKGKNK